MQLIRLGTTLINMANVVVVQLGEDTAELLTTAPDYTLITDTDRPAPTAHIIKLRGDEAAALRHLLIEQNMDMLIWYRNIPLESTV